jgi:hypothetical protein
MMKDAPHRFESYVTFATTSETITYHLCHFLFSFEPENIYGNVLASEEVYAVCTCFDKQNGDCLCMSESEIVLIVQAF